MRKIDRMSTLVLTGLLATVSCSVVPAPLRDGVVAFADGSGASVEQLAAEAHRIALTLRAWDTGLGAAETEQLARVIVHEAHAAGLSPALVLAVIEVESSGKNFAVSGVGARGLMQLLPSTGEFVAATADLPWHGPDTLFDPVINVRLGVRYLQHLSTRYPDLRTTLAAYNWGPGSIAGRLARGEPLPRRYADRVLEVWAQAGREI